jgi:hypothetical protein
VREYHPARSNECTDIILFDEIECAVVPGTATIIISRSTGTSILDAVSVQLPAITS